MRFFSNSSRNRRSYDLSALFPQKDKGRKVSRRNSSCADNVPQFIVPGVPNGVVLRRYTAVYEQPAESWVSVSSLQSLSDGGILDPDDQLISVVDDRDQILAIFEEQDAPQNIPGEGRSGESSEWGSHRGSGRKNASFRGSRGPTVRTNGVSDSSVSTSRLQRNRDSPVQNWVEVTDINALPNSGLLVVRPFDEITVSNGSNNVSPNKNNESLSRQASQTSQDSDQLGPLPSSHTFPTSSENNRFSRNDARKSALTNTWFEAYERAEQRHKNTQEDLSVSLAPESSTSSNFRTIEITVGGRPGQPLAIQVAPDYGDRGRLSSIIVKQIHEGGRVVQDGQILLEDRIVEINERPIYQMSFVRAQTYLHEASLDEEVIFKIQRFAKDNISPADSGTAASSVMTSSTSSNTLPAAPQSNLQKANIKKIGQKFDIELTKGNAGLGFTVTSRDTAVDGKRPFYIKTVLPRGAAIDDGRLKSGDRLLEVAGKPVTGLLQKDVVDMLRQVPTGSKVMLLVSRLEETRKSSPNLNLSHTKSPSVVAETKLLAPICTPARPLSPSPSLPRALPLEKARLESLGSERCKRTLTLDIALNSSGCAGLGVSVKGRTAANSQSHAQQDCGIFIKTVMHGGAAHKDGRLRVNDQLIAIDKVSLIGCTNLQSMNLISQTMQNLNPDAKNIQLKVLRVENGHYFNPLNESSGSEIDVEKNGLVAVHSVMSTEEDSLYLDLDDGHMQRGVIPILPPDSQPPPIPPRYIVPGYGDYAMVIKPGKSTVPLEDNGPVIIAEDDVYDDVREDVHMMDNERLEDNESVIAGDTFVRDAPTRRSMSEKRHGPNSGNDPSHTQTYQRIKHQRQASAPLLDCADVAGRLRYSPDFSATTTLPNNGKLTNLANQRRSMSVESLTRKPLTNGHSNGRPPSLMVSQPMIHEIAIQRNEQKETKKGKKAGDRKRPTNDSFRQAVDKSYQTVPGMEVGVDIGDVITPHDADTMHHSLSRPHKDKSRRKSMGHIFSRGWLTRFGSGRSRDSSPEKQDEKDNEESKKKAYKAEAERIREQYERLKKEHHVRLSSPHRIPSPKLPSHWVPPQSKGSPQPPPYSLARRYPPYHCGAPLLQGIPPPQGTSLHRTYMGPQGPVTISPGTYFNRGIEFEYQNQDSNQVQWYTPRTTTTLPQRRRPSPSTRPYGVAWEPDRARKGALPPCPTPRSATPPGAVGTGHPNGGIPRSSTVERAVSRPPGQEIESLYPSAARQPLASQNFKEPVIPAPDYEQFLRKHKRSKSRPASNYCEYRTMQLTVASEPNVYSNPVYADTSNEGFIVHM